MYLISSVCPLPKHPYYLCVWGSRLHHVYIPLTYLVHPYYLCVWGSCLHACQHILYFPGAQSALDHLGTEAASLQTLFSLAHITEIPKEVDSWDVW